MNTHSTARDCPVSIIHGSSLAEEPGLGPLTLAGFVREVTERFGPNEAAVIHHEDGRIEHWNYAELWDRSVAVARALPVAAARERASAC